MMTFRNLVKTSALAFAISFVHCTDALANIGLYDKQLKKGEIHKTILSINELLDKQYIFPEISEKIRLHLNSKLENGEYQDITNAHDLAEQLTVDIQSLSHDRHLRVFFDPKRVVRMKHQLNSMVDPAQVEKERLAKRSKNHGFKQVSILNGNIGYLDLRQFDYPDKAADTLAASMQFLENTDALIFDLRQNGGGSPSMVQLIISYLLDAEQVHLNDIYKRNLNLTKQYWSLSAINGKRRPDIDVYILTSRGTFSAAEDFSYTLKHLNRATIIGEKTGGGAHPGGRQIATDRFLVWVPTARSINPITGTNWEGVGVIPHVEQSSELALDTAHIMALEKLLETGKGSEAINKWYLTSLKTLANPVKIDAALLKQYAGKYGLRTLTFENGALYYQRKGNNKFKLVPINDKLFMVEGNDDFRIKIIVEQDQVVAIQGLSDNGSVSHSARQAS